VRAFALLITPANEPFGCIHDRMPALNATSSPKSPAYKWLRSKARLCSASFCARASRLATDDTCHRSANLMGELQRYGMKSAFDEIMATAVKRQPQRIIAGLLTAEIFEQQPRSIKYQLTIAKLPLAMTLTGLPRHEDRSRRTHLRRPRSASSPSAHQGFSVGGCACSVGRPRSSTIIRTLHSQCRAYSRLVSTPPAPSTNAA
jgi:hypothetical protein